MSNCARLACLFLALAVLSGCAATTRLTDTWSDPSVTSPIPFKKVLVLVVNRDPEVRKEAEGYLTVLMKNTQAVPAFIAIPESALRDPVKVKEILTSNGYDGAVVSRLIGVSQETTWVSTAYPDFWGYYGWAMPYVYSPSYAVTDTTVKLETRIYSLQENRLVWSGLSSAFNPTSVNQILNELTQVISEDLRKNHLIP